MSPDTGRFLESMFSLRGRLALVTGASSGLGRHFSLTLARAGATVAVAARRRERLSELVVEIEALGGHALDVSMDVAERDSVIQGLDEIVDRHGAPDIVVNNAGVSDTRRALDYDDQAWDAIVGTNLKGAWVVAQESARRMVAAGRGGCIVNLTSILASRVAGGVGPYCASKAGLAQLTRALALEFARHDIRVNSLAPGYVATELNAAFLDSEPGLQLRARIPQRRFGRPEDLDAALLMLVSPAAAYVTGSEVVVDGGHLCTSI